MDIFLHLFRRAGRTRSFYDPGHGSILSKPCRSWRMAALLRLGFLDIDGVPAALSCALSTAVRSICTTADLTRVQASQRRASVQGAQYPRQHQRGKKVYDFLKGAEVYKQRLGGRPVPLLPMSLSIRFEQYVEGTEAAGTKVKRRKLFTSRYATGYNLAQRRQ